MDPKKPPYINAAIFFTGSCFAHSDDQQTASGHLMQAQTIQKFSSNDGDHKGLRKVIVHKTKQRSLKLTNFEMNAALKITDMCPTNTRSLQH